MPDPSRKFMYRDGDLKITYPDGTVVDPRADAQGEPQDEPDDES